MNNNSYEAKIYKAGEGHEEDKDICIIEGICPKCNAGNNTLIIYDYKINKVKKEDSIIKFICMICLKKSSVYYRNVISGKPKEE